MVQTSNQFAMTPEKGMLTLDPNWSTLNVQVSVNEAGTLSPAQAVTIEDAAGSQIPVLAATVNTAAIFGFVTYNVRTDSYAAQDQVKIAKNGDVMLMEAGAAIARGATVEVTIIGSKVATKASGTSVGTALDKAAADGDLIRVLITV